VNIKDGGLLCNIIDGLALIGTGALYLYPEPGSTAFGSVALADLVASGCTVGQLADELPSDCDDDFTHVNLCVDKGGYCFDPTPGGCVSIDPPQAALYFGETIGCDP